MLARFEVQFLIFLFLYSTDANLIAIANEVSDESRSRAIQKRVDRGQCSAASGGGAQFVSERYYGPEDTTGGNIGVLCG